MDIYCQDCSVVTNHNFIGIDPDSGSSLLECVECENRQYNDVEKCRDCGSFIDDDNPRLYDDICNVCVDNHT